MPSSRDAFSCCETQVPLRARRRGAARAAARRRAARAAAIAADRVSVPFKWYPKEELLPHAAAWRHARSVGSERRADRPRHRDEVPDLLRAPSAQGTLAHAPAPRGLRALRHARTATSTTSKRDVALRDTLMALDDEMLGECAAAVHQSRGTPSARLARYNGLASDAALPSAAARRAGSTPGALRRLRAVGRPARSATSASICDRPRAGARPPAHVRLIVVGDGPLRRAARATRPSDAASPIGSRLPAPSTTTRWSSCTRTRSRVVFAPFDEDYGYVTLEAFLARKPVMTATRLPAARSSSSRTASTASSSTRRRRRSAPAIARLAGDRTLAQSLGDAGYERARAISWDGVVDRLMADGSPSADIGRRCDVSSRDPRVQRERAVDRATSVGPRPAAAAPWREILVVDDGSSDDTGAQRRGRRRPRHPPSVQQGQRRRGEDRHPPGDRRVRPDHRRRRPAPAGGRDAARRRVSTTTISSSARARRRRRRRWSRRARQRGAERASPAT